MSNIEIIKKVLESNAGFNNENKVIDNRLYLIKKYIQEEKNKDKEFYQKLLFLIGTHINELYIKEINETNIVLNKDNTEAPKRNSKLSYNDKYELKIANKNLSKALFDYVCDLLENNKNIELDYETLKILLNRNPKEFSLSTGKEYLYRTLDYPRLAKIIKENGILKDFSNYAIYQLLKDSFQINNRDVFKILVDKETYEKDHQFLDYFLSNCNVRTFIEVTNIIRTNYDNEYDRLSIIKKKKNNFPEVFIMELLNWTADEDDYNLIHQILTDKDININYNEYYSDYFGYSDLKSIIAIYGNGTIVKDLLKNENNIQNFYYKGDTSVYLYEVYAKAGIYDKAIASLNNIYIEGQNLPEEFFDDIYKQGFSKTELGYGDSLVDFFKEICKSLKESDLNSTGKNNIICEILRNKKIKYFNAEKILPILKETLDKEEYKKIIEQLKEKHLNGETIFITSTELSNEVILKIMSYEEFEKLIQNIDDNNKIKTLM